MSSRAICRRRNLNFYLQRSRCIQAQCASALAKMHDKRTVVPEYLSSQGGTKSFAQQQNSGHADSRGCESTNDKFAESVFGTFDRMLKRNLNISREAASGLAQSMHNRSFFHEGDHVQRRKQLAAPSPAAGMGYFYSLPPQEQEALVIYSTRTVRQQRKVDAEHNSEVAAYIKSKVRARSEEELQNLITEFGYAISFFERWQQRGVQTLAEADAALKAQPSCQLRLDWLREQIEMRTRGLQWVEFRAAWSSSKDEHIGSIEELRDHLKEILSAERDRRSRGELPATAPAPLMKRKSFKELGTPTIQASEFAERHTQLTDAELRAAAERERERLEALGEIDRVGDRQPAQPPRFDSLVGKHIDIRWRYWTKEGNGKRKQVYIWCTGEVVEVADGKTTRRSSKCKSTLPWGAVRVKWAADSEYGEEESYVWSVLEPHNWCKEAHLGWRLAESELIQSCQRS